jgi:ABC-type uncharacterized transport system permease subunit
MPITLSLLLYCLAWYLLYRRWRKQESKPGGAALALTALAALVHAYAAYGLMATPLGYSFSLFKIATLFVWVATVLVLVSSLRKPLHSLLWLLLPCNITILLAALFLADRPDVYIRLDYGIAAHIILAILAYSTLILASLHALILSYQNRALHGRHATGWVRLLPPLLTMEALLFELLWVGMILLTLALITGGLFLEDIFAQHLAQKTVFALLSWIIYAVLLWGRHALGWRGHVAVRGTLLGFVFLALAYMGSKFVLEYLLNR